MAANTDAAANCKVVLAGGIAKRLLVEVAEGLKQTGKPPVLVGFLSSTDPAARVYADWTGRTCRENGFEFHLREVDREELEDAIMAANTDDAVDGIMVYYPIFGSGQDRYIQQTVDVSKDVEGLTDRYVRNMYHNVRFLDGEKQRKSILPCTPLAIVKILEYLQIYNTFLPYGNRLHGHTITVINRSEVVGRPLAALLANDGACVYSVDVNNIQQFTRGEGLREKKHKVMDDPKWTLENRLLLSDVVISGVPGDSFKVPIHLMREGAVCINFSSEKNFGPDVKQKASIYVPAIGKVTIVVLLRNLLRIVQNRRDMDGRPAAAVEKNGTLEQAAPAQ